MKRLAIAQQEPAAAMKMESAPHSPGLFVREHGTIERDGDEQLHGCVYPGGAQRILFEQDGGENSCFEQGVTVWSSRERTIDMSDNIDPDVDGCTAKQIGRGGNTLGGVDTCESERSCTEQHGVEQTGVC